MRVLSLFTGIGAHDLGFERASMQIVGQCEIDPFCLRVLEKHWPGLPRWNDVRDVSGAAVLERCGRVDLITGGFPCTDISVAGKGRGIGTSAEPTDRSGLVWELLRVVSEVRPDWVVFENVPRLRTLGADTILGHLAEQAYTCWTIVVGAEHVGAPHRRHRVWIIGKRVEDPEIARGRTVPVPRKRISNPDADGTGEGSRSLADPERSLGGGWPRRTGLLTDREEAGRNDGVGGPVGHGEAGLAHTGRLQSQRRRDAGDVANTTGTAEADGAERKRLRNALDHGGPDGSGVGMGTRDEPRDGCGDGSDQLDHPTGPRRAGDAGCQSARSVRDEARGTEPAGSCRSIVRWPSRPGQPQHDWEEPRLIQIARFVESEVGIVVDGIAPGLVRLIAERHRLTPEAAEDWIRRNLYRVPGHWRRHALKAIGNANPPQVAEVVARAIMSIRESREEKIEMAPAA